MSVLYPLHLGALHPYEKILTLVLAFGPFVLLGLVIWWRQTHPDPDEESVEEQTDLRG